MSPPIKAFLWERQQFGVKLTSLCLAMLGFLVLSIKGRSG
jgi:hypothetical protein